MKGSCLCGGVVFEVTEVVGPFEICHCNRCRKVSGAAAMPGIGVKTSSYTLLQGADLIQEYAAPYIYGPPAYLTYFCAKCGSPTPPANPTGETFEIAAGLLDDDPGLQPDKHIFVEHVPAWDHISDKLSQHDLKSLYELKHGEPLPESFEQKSHYD